MIRRVLTLVALLGAMATSAISIEALVATPAQAKKITNRCEFTDREPVLRRGSTDATAVRQAQCELNYSMRGERLKVDGSFGPKTERAVRRFQRCANIGVDGIVGPRTWSKLNHFASGETWAC